MLTSNNQIIGKCSICGGDVCCPAVWWSTVAPIPTCVGCGAVEDNDMPVMKMKHRGVIKNYTSTSIEIRTCSCRNGCKSWDCDKL
jgi:hypothetical protein